MTQENKTPVKAVSLKSLMTPSKTVKFDYPGFEGLKVELCYLAREELVKLRNRCVIKLLTEKQEVMRKQWMMTKFVSEYTKAVIKGWKGFKLGYAKTTTIR